MTDKQSEKMLKNGVANFFSKKKEYRSLSNFWETDVVIDDGGEERVYESGEHCFYGEKYIRLGISSRDEWRKQELMDYGATFLKPSIYITGADVKKKGGKKGILLSVKETNEWEKISTEVQMEICRWKVENYEEVINDLFKSENKILIHPALRCSEERLVKNELWGGKGVVIDDKIVVLGKNRLGNIWMKLRSEIMRENN